MLLTGRILISQTNLLADMFVRVKKWTLLADMFVLENRPLQTNLKGKLTFLKPREIWLNFGLLTSDLQTMLGHV